jgi:hypothetical protein
MIEGMDTKPSYFQLSLRTILEVIAFAAIILALIYQRPQPQGRYQISSYAAMNPNGHIQGCYIVDTQTGTLWHVTATGSPYKMPPLP